MALKLEDWILFSEEVYRADTTDTYQGKGEQHLVSHWVCSNPLAQSKPSPEVIRKDPADTEGSGDKAWH